MLVLSSVAVFVRKLFGAQHGVKVKLVQGGESTYSPWEGVKESITESEWASRLGRGAPGKVGPDLPSEGTGATGTHRALTYHLPSDPCAC